jgi:hypothetical protein
MQVLPIAAALLFSLTSAIASPTNTRLSRRTSNIIVEENIKVNNATDDLHGRLMVIKKVFERNQKKPGVDDIINLFTKSNGDLVTRLQNGASKIQNGQEDVKAAEADNVMTLREAYSSQIQNILKAIGPEGIRGDIGPTAYGPIMFSLGLKAQRNASDIFSSTVVSRMPIGLKGILNEWHAEAQTVLDATIRYYDKLVP